MTRPRSPFLWFHCEAPCRSAAFAVLVALGALFATVRVASAQISRRDSSTTRPIEVYSRDSIPAYRRRLIGVYDDATGMPLDSVRVTDMLTGLSMLTSRTGTATLLFLPEGGSLVRLQKIGYATTTRMIAIDRADTTPVTELMARVTVLSPVVVRDSAELYLSPTLRNFEQRKQAGIGHFIDEAEMRKHENWTMSRVLTSLLPGLMPAPSPSRAAEYIISSRTMCSGRALTMCKAPNCYPAVYLDGVRYTEVASVQPNAVDFSKWSPTEFAAAEFYQAVLPEEFEGANAKCGVLLLWTRER